MFRCHGPCPARSRRLFQTNNKLSALEVTADVSSSNLEVLPFRDLRTQARLRWRRSDPSAVEVESATVRAPEGTIVANATWQGTGPESTNRVSARIQNLDLARLGRTLNLSIEVASQVNGSIEAQWPGLSFEEANADARLQVVPLRQNVEQGVVPVSGTISAKARDRRLTVSAQSVEAMGASLDAEIGATLNPDQRFNGPLSGTVRGRVTEVRNVLTDVRAFRGEEGGALVAGQPVSGSAAFNLDLGGSIDRPTATAMLSGSGIQYGPLKNVNVNADAGYDPARLTVSRASLTWEDAEIRADGSVELQGANRALDFHATTSEIPIPQVLAVLEQQLPISGRAALDVRGGGTLEQPKISLDLQGHDLAAYGEQLGDLNTRATLLDKTVQIESLRLDRPEGKGTLTADGSFQTETRDYTFHVQGSGLAIHDLQIPGQPAVQATVDLSGDGAGNLDNPSANVKLSVRDAEWNGRALGSLDMQAKTADHAASATVEAPKFGVHAEAEGKTESPYPLTVRATAQNTDLSLLSSVRGHVTAQLQASGEPEHWRDGMATLTVSDARLETDAGEFRNSGDVQLAYGDRTVKVVAANIAGPMSTMSLQGELPLEETGTPGAVHYQAQGDLAALTPASSSGTGLNAQGQLQIEGDVRGSLAKLTPSGTIRLQDGSVMAPGLKSPLQAIQLNATLENGVLSVEQLQASLGNGSLSGHGTIPLSLFPVPPLIEIPRQSAPAQFSLQLSKLSLDSLAGLPEKMKGQVGFTLETEASRPELDAVRAQLTFNQLDLDLAGIALTARMPPVITLQNGAVRIDQFTLQGPNSEIRLSGGTSLSDRDLRDVHLSGHMDAALLGGFVNDLATAGSLQFDVAAQGKWDQPALTGSVEMASGQVSFPSPRVDVSDLSFRAALQNDKIEIERFQGDVNGGMLALAGAVGLRPEIQPDLHLTASDVYLDFPAGLRTLSNLDLRLRPQQNQLLLSGDVTIEEGSYTDLLDLQNVLQRFLQSRGAVQLAEERTPFLDRLRFDVAVKSRDPVVMDNNLGKLAFAADLRLLGNYYRPGMTGHISLEEGGTLRLQENEYGIEQGTINFVNEARIEPQVNIQASTRVRDNTLTVDVTTDPKGEITTNFSSDDPTLTRADIISLLLTGRTAEELQGGQMNTAGGEAAASLVAGSVTGRLSQELQGTLGLSRVRVEPDLISTEADPTARLTIGQDLTSALELIYSMNLRNSSDQIWIVRYQLARRFSTQATKQEDNTYRFDFKHDLRFGGMQEASAAATAKKERRIGKVEFTGEPAFPEKTLSDKFKVKSGDRYDFFKLRKGLDRLESFYHDQGYLEAKVRMHREQESAVNLTVNIEAGQRVDFAFENWAPPGGLRNRVRDDWEHGAFDSQRAESALAEIRRTLGRDGYLKPQLEYEIKPAGDRKLVIFMVNRGTRYDGAELVFAGAKGIEPKTLEQQLKKAKLADKLESNPAQVRDFLNQYYRQEGFLDASVTGPEYQYDEAAAKAQVHFAIDEGPKYRWGQFSAKGASVYTPAELEEFSGLKMGAAYTPQAAQDSRDHVEEAYWKKGYRDVVVDYNLSKRPGEGRIDLTADIQEGPQSIVQDIQVKGTDQTSPSFVTKQIDLKPGDVLDYTKTADSRRALYSTGAFSSVDLRAEPLAENPDLSAKSKYVQLLADVRERTPFQIRYGGFYDTDRGPGAIVDFWNRNSLGGGRVVGGQLRYDGDVHEARAFFSQPLLHSFPLRTDTSTFVRREFTSSFITDRVGVSVQQGLRLRNKFLLTYGYRFEHAHTYDTNQDAFFPFDETLRVAPLTATLTRDSRDDLLDATHGSFTSHSVEYATSQLGSTLLFAKYFGQYFHYLPLTAPAPIPFGKGREKPRVVYAGGIRIGLAKGLGGQPVIPSERFFAGGGTTIRGFKQNTLGPYFADSPAGGDAMLIVNNELRFPMFKMFDGVGFVDIGNVYPKLSDFSITDVRKTGGAGLRIRTPYLLLRLDYGFKLDRKHGESLGALFFSIGQAY